MVNGLQHWMMETDTDYETMKVNLSSMWIYGTVPWAFWESESIVLLRVNGELGIDVIKHHLNA